MQTSRIDSSLNQNHHDPFGMLLEGRNWEGGSDNSYRFGFENQEIDKEIWSGGVSFKYRIEDARIGRFFAVDPLNYEYPHNSPYAFCENRLLDRNELEGLETGPTFSEIILLAKTSKLSLVEASNILYAQPTESTIAMYKLGYGFTPIGPVIDVWDFSIAAKNGDTEGMIIAGAGFIPGGDFLKAKNVKKISILSETFTVNKQIGKAGEKIVTKTLTEEAGQQGKLVFSQVYGKFEDGQKIVYDDVIFNPKTGKIDFTSETKTGGAKLSDSQQRAKKGEFVTITSKKVPISMKGQKISSKTTPYKEVYLERKNITPIFDY